MCLGSGENGSDEMGIISAARRPTGVTYVTKASASQLAWDHRQWAHCLSPSDDVFFGQKAVSEGGGYVPSASVVASNKQICLPSQIEPYAGPTLPSDDSPSTQQPRKSKFPDIRSMPALLHRVASPSERRVDPL